MNGRVALMGAGNTIMIAAGLGDSGGLFALLVYELAPGFTCLPLHLHQREDEALYVLEGRLLVTVGQAERLVGPGEFIFQPRGIAHAQRNPGPEQARFLVVFIPAGFEQCVHEIDALLEGGASLSPEAITPLLARYGVQPMEAMGAEQRARPLDAMRSG
jgi:quercetin dioxygenase-like cupin family protein